MFHSAELLISILRTTGQPESEMSNKERKRCPGDSLPGKRLSSANNAQMAKCSRRLAGHSLPPTPYTVHNFCFSLKFIEKFQRKTIDLVCTSTKVGKVG